MLINEAKQNLIEHITPFWRNLKDDKHGGFYGYMDFNLQPNVDAIKGVILHSRILWFFSNEYLTLGNEETLAYAKHAYDFIINNCLDKEYGGVYWMLNAEGIPVDDMKHTYNQAFAIYALSSYYDATKDRQALDHAMTLFKLIEERCTDEYGYLEAFDRYWTPISNEKLSDNEKLTKEGKIAEKTMNTILHVMEAYTELYRVSKDATVGNKLRHILKLTKEKIYIPEKQILGVFFDKTLNNLADMHSYGHDIEAAWLLDRAAEVLGDEVLKHETYAYTKELAYKVLEVAFDGKALNNERFNTTIDTTRIWWVQAEAVVGFLNAYEKTHDKVFLETAQKIWDYINTYFIDSRSGEWFWDLDDTDQPTSKKPIVEPWKCPYHNGRMFFEIIRRRLNV